MPETECLAVFDFDGTLHRRDSLLPFLFSLVGRRRTVGAFVTAPFCRRLLGEPRRDELKAAMLRRLLTGVSHARIAATAGDYSRELIDDLRPDVVDRLRWHQAAGHRTVIASASLGFYLRPVARHLNSGLLATELSSDRGGLLTGEIDGRNCRGPEKVRRLVSAFPVRPSSVWAYGDSAGDRDMLHWADHAIRITSATVTSSPTVAG